MKVVAGRTFLIYTSSVTNVSDNDIKERTKILITNVSRAKLNFHR